MQGYVTSHIEHGINTIEFFHPQSNAMPSKLLQSLANEIHFAGTHEETKVIILRSSDGDPSDGRSATFCAGAHFDELAAVSTLPEATHFFTGFARVLNAMRKCPKFIIGRIHGKCIGGGVGLAAAVDYAIAVTGADIKLSELTLGIGPFVVGPAIERKIGTAAFSALALDATKWRNSDWAKRKGLYAEVHESTANMDESIVYLSNTLSRSSPAAMAAIKKMNWHGTENWDELLVQRAAESGQLAIGSYTRAAIEKFKAKSKS